MALRVTLLEPYYGGSHRAWADGYQNTSQHTVDLLTLPAQAWKWRMQGGAVSLARMFSEQALNPDVILASSMMDVSTFCALTRSHTHSVPVALYLHENQLTYPQNSRQGHGWRYGFINYISAMSADLLLFNSDFHLNEFFSTLPNMLKHFYDFNELQTVELLRNRATVLEPGLDLKQFDTYRVGKLEDEAPLIVWNHRWEEDKNPRLFLNTLYKLQDAGYDFRVAILGENTRHDVPEFQQAQEHLGERIIQSGFVERFEDYAQLLWHADYVVSTAIQEFFGISIAEAIYCECVPVLPNRLNYPKLIPKISHNACLYPQDNDLLSLLASHLDGNYTVNTTQLRGQVAQYDWTTMAPRYDEMLTRLVQGRPLAQ